MVYQAYTTEDFEGLSDSNQQFFTNLANRILFISESITEFECVLACVGVVVNLFHMLVLTRNTMTMNSVNVMMIGIALCDLFNMSFNVYDTTMILIQKSDKCRPPLSYSTKLIEFWASAFEDHTRRLSSLYGVMMALTRYLIIKNALNSKFEIISKSLFALGAMFITFVLSTILTLLFWSRYEVMEIKPWKPSAECPGFPLGYSVPQYKSSLDSVYLMEDSIYLQIFSVLDGLIKIIPTAMFPVLTFLLIKELKKAESSRRKVSAVNQKEESSKSDQATKVVVLMAVFYMAAEGPLGVLYVVQGFVTSPTGIMEMTVDLIDIFGVFVSINAIMHCIICLTVSSQYQKTAKNVFCCVKCLAGRKTKPLPNATKVSVSSAGRVRKSTMEQETSR